MLDPFDAPLTGQEGIQFLCAKYSSLITRLREEVLSRQSAEAEARLLEKRLHEEARHWESERGLWTAERIQLRSEVSALRTQILEERKQIRQDLTHRSQQNQIGSIASDLETHQSHQKLISLLHEHSKLQTEHRDLREELMRAQALITKWKQRVSDLEFEATQAMKAQQETEQRNRSVQDEMRQALRSAACQRTRAELAQQSACKGEKDSKSKDERLRALRHEGRLHFQRACSAERRLAIAEIAEVERQELICESSQLRNQLHIALARNDAYAVSEQKAEQSEANAAYIVGELRGELRAAEALNRASSERCAELQGSLTGSRQALAVAHSERLSSCNRSELLSQELAEAQHGQQEAVQTQHKLTQDLHEVQKRLQRLVGTGSGPGQQGQIVELKLRVSQLEHECRQREDEHAEERRARERCHLEAIRLGEKLCLAQASLAQARERLLILEEEKLRHPLRNPSSEVICRSQSSKNVRKTLKSDPVVNPARNVGSKPWKQLNTQTKNTEQIKLHACDDPNLLNFLQPSNPLNLGTLASQQSTGEPSMLGVKPNQHDNFVPVALHLSLPEEPRLSPPSPSNFDVAHDRLEILEQPRTQNFTDLSRVVYTGSSESDLYALLSVKPKVLQLPGIDATSLRDVPTSRSTNAVAEGWYCDAAPPESTAAN